MCSWNTNTCPVGTHMCAHVNAQMRARGTHIRIHVNTHTCARGADTCSSDNKHVFSWTTSRLGDNGRQMNSSTQKETNEPVHPESRARYPETHAGRQRETNEPVHPESCARHAGWETTGGRQRETNQPVHPGEPCQASRLGDNGRKMKGDTTQSAVPGMRARVRAWTNEGKMKGDKGRQMNPSTQRAAPGIQAGRQRRKGHKEKQMNPSTQREPCQAFKLANNGRQQRERPREPRQASRLGNNGGQMKGEKGRQQMKRDKGRRTRPPSWLGNRRVTLNEFRTPHSKLFGEKVKPSDRPCH